MRIWVGVDPGERRIGVARSDPLGLLARPHSILQSVADLVQLLESWQPEIHGVVVGLPRNMNGTYGPLARRSAALVEHLRGCLDTPLVMWDERLTTRQAQSHPGVRRGEAVDARAAAILLQSFLDAGAPEREDPPELAGPPSA